MAPPGAIFFFQCVPIIQQSSGEHSRSCTMLASNHSMLTTKMAR